MLSRWICYVLAAALSLLAMAVGLVEILFRLEVQPRLDLDRAAQVKYFQNYLEDLKALEPLPLMRQLASAHSDAGTLLNDRLYWTPPGPKTRGLAKPMVSAETRETLMRFRTEWMRKYERVKHIPVDLSIFHEISRFDYWDIERGSPIEDLSQAHAFVPPPRLPLPDIQDLLALMKLRLMSGAVQGDFVGALSEVRQLSTLMLSTENQQLVLAGLVGLEYERFAYQFYVDAKKMPPGLWLPSDPEALRRAHRAVLATRAFLHLWTRPDILDKVFLSSPTPPVGLCAAVNQAYPLEFSLRTRLEPNWPLETNLSAEYAMLDAILKRARGECRIRYLTELVSADAIHIRVPGPFLLNRLPYARKVFGLRVSAVNFQGFDAYEVKLNP